MNDSGCDDDSNMATVIIITINNTTIKIAITTLKLQNVQIIVFKIIITTQ